MRAFIYLLFIQNPQFSANLEKDRNLKHVLYVGDALFSSWNCDNDKGNSPMVSGVTRHPSFREAGLICQSHNDKEPVLSENIALHGQQDYRSVS